MVLTKKELDDQDWWNQNVVFTEKNPADGKGTVTIDHTSIFWLRQEPKKSECASQITAS